MIDDLILKFNCFKDDKFKFDSLKHKYTYDGREYTSVTNFINNFHKEFDEDLISEKVSKKSGVSQDEILSKWKEKNERSKVVGHSTHQWIENYYKRIPQWLPNDIDIVNRINKFNIVYANYMYKLTPIVFEIKIFSKIYPIAGTIDSIFLYKGNLFIVDYKTNGDFTHDEHNKGRYENLLIPFEHLWKNHLNEYSIQVSLYSLILEEWGFNIKGSYLVHLGPNDEPKIYKSLDLREIIKNYLPIHNW